MYSLSRWKTRMTACILSGVVAFGTLFPVPAEAAGKKRNTKEIDLVAKLFDEIAPKYENRNGGYTRIVKIGPRKGDAAMEVLIELV